MNKAETNLFFARFFEPELRWYVQENGKVYSMAEDDGEGSLEFDIDNPRDRQKVIILLQQDHGWAITGRTRSGETYWQATRQGLSLEHGDLVILLKQVVEGLGK